MTTNLERTLRKMEEELKLGGYSPTTVSSYHGAASRFLRHTGKPSNKLTHDDVRRYILYLTDKRKAASSTINQTHFAIRFLYKNVLNKGWRTKLSLHKRPERIPIVLSREEIAKLLDATEAPKYKTIWMVLYGAGLRVSEAVRLRVGDIDSDAMRLLVRNGKGGKDRYAPISKGLLEQLRIYWKIYRPHKWLFYGRDPKQPLLSRTVQKAFQEAKTRARILKEATPHSLRHAYATHMMENGANLLYIKDLLGHRSIKSTLVYLKITRDGLDRPENPLDQLLKSARSKRR